MAGPDETVSVPDSSLNEQPCSNDVDLSDTVPVNMAEILLQCEALLGIGSNRDNEINRINDSVSERLERFLSEWEYNSQSDRRIRDLLEVDVVVLPIIANFDQMFIGERYLQSWLDIRAAERRAREQRTQAASQFSEKLFGLVWSKASQEYFSAQGVDLILFSALMERLENHLVYLSEEEQAQVIEQIKSARPEEVFRNNWVSIPTFLEVLQGG